MMILAASAQATSSARSSAPENRSPGTLLSLTWPSKTCYLMDRNVWPMECVFSAALHSRNWTN